MAKEDYVPKREADQIPWSATLKTKIATHGATVGLSAGDITTVQGNCDTVKGSIETFNTATQVYQAAANTKNTAKNPAIKSIREFAQRIKKHASYDTTIGEELGIIGDEQTIDVPNSQPELKHAKVPSGHEFKFNLKAFFDGVNIYKKAPGAATFAFLARDTQSPYIDTAAVENGTEYYALYVLGDTEVGQRSSVVNVSV
ncbi:MAG: hypothetical protein ACHQNT_02700 [Bacteroidia bacterium]